MPSKKINEMDKEELVQYMKASLKYTRNQKAPHGTGHLNYIKRMWDLLIWVVMDAGDLLLNGCKVRLLADIL